MPLEKLVFCQPIGSVPCTQQAVSCPRTGSIQSTTSYPISWRFILILSCHLRLGLPFGAFPSDAPVSILYVLVLPPYMPLAPPFSFSLILLTWKYLMRSTKSCRSWFCSVFYPPLIPPLPLDPYSAPCFRTSQPLLFHFNMRNQTVTVRKIKLSITAWLKSNHAANDNRQWSCNRLISPGY